MKNIFIVIFPMVFWGCVSQSSLAQAIEPTPEIEFYLKRSEHMTGISGECLKALDASIENHNDYFSGKKYTVTNGDELSVKEYNMVIGKDVYIRGFECDSSFKIDENIITMIYLSGEEDLKYPLLGGLIITYLDANYNVVKWGH